MRNLLNSYVHNANYATASRPTPSNLPDPYTLGSVFEDINQAKDALLQYTVAKGLSYQLEPTDKRRHIVECRSE